MIEKTRKIFAVLNLLK